jgi:hypothetical protein
MRSTRSAAYYLINVSGTTYLDLETTGHTTDSSTGIEIMSGTNGNQKTLVGMIHTDSGKQVATQGQNVTAGDTNTVATWDNRKPTSTQCGFTTTRSLTGTVGYVEINLENRCYFMSWGDAAVFTNDLVGYNNTAGSACQSLLFLDSGSSGVRPTFGSPVQPSSTLPSPDMFMLLTGSANLTEGYHLTLLYGGETSGTTCTWIAGGGSNSEYEMVYTVQ